MSFCFKATALLGQGYLLSSRKILMMLNLKREGTRARVPSEPKAFLALLVPGLCVPIVSRRGGFHQVTKYMVLLFPGTEGPIIISRTSEGLVFFSFSRTKKAPKAFEMFRILP